MSLYTSIIVVILLSLLVLSILIHENDRIPSQKKRLFYVANMLIGASALAECAGIHISVNSSIDKHILSFVKAIDYTLTPLAGGIFIFLMHKPGHKKTAIAIASIFAINAVFQIVSIFTNWMIIVNDNNTYVHGPAYSFYTVLYIIVFVILLIELVCYGKRYRKENRNSLYAIALLLLVGIVLQQFVGSDLKVVYIVFSFGSAYLFIHYSEFSQMEMDDEINVQKIIISKDALTGVYSRFAYHDAITKYSNNIQNDLAVFLIDINGLKKVNDSLGHEAGDELICGAAHCISSTIGKNDRTYRIGGDEFVVITRMSREEADKALIELNDATSRWSGQKVKKLSVSAGYALSCDHSGLGIEQLTKEADKEMYKQKKIYHHN